jgi:maleate cis-trans isomerase
MHFEDVRLQEIVHRIEDRFNVTVIAENAALYECLVTVDLTDQSLKNTLHLISGTLAVQYQQQGRTIVLKGGECH